MSRVIYEVKFEVSDKRPAVADILSDVILSNGVKPKDIVENTTYAGRNIIVYFKDIADALRLKRRISRYQLNNIKIKFRSFPNKSWQDAWKKEFKPFLITRHIKIIPSWLKNKEPIGRKIPVYIDTSTAFGTGLHATTRFMASFIDDKKGKFDTLLDVGTGTGILAILGKKLGAEKVLALDCSKDAIHIARKNAQDNQCRAITFRLTNFKNIATDAKYDFVAANLISADLIMFAQKLVSLIKPGKYLAISGVSLFNFEKVHSEFSRLPLKCLKIEKEEGWAGLLYRRN